jgi:hypothetical protein
MPSATTPTVSEATPAYRSTSSRLGSVLPPPADERKKPAGKRIAAAQIPVRARKPSTPSSAAEFGKDLTNEGEDDENARMCVACAREGALERGGRLPPASDAQHEEAAVLDRNERE